MELWEKADFLTNWGSRERNDRMKKVFNTTAVCIPEEHYMVNLEGRLRKVKKLVDQGKYFTINRARQYGKTTLLRALYRYLQKEYYVVLMDFQTFGSAEFQTEERFARSFAGSFARLFKRNVLPAPEMLYAAFGRLNRKAEEDPFFSLKTLFEMLSEICAVADRPVVLMIDEVDSAANNQVFLDFLAQLRAQYIDRDIQPTFQSVILAGVYDIRNLKRKLRKDEEHQYNSPWNIAAEFTVDMSFDQTEIAEMLREYELDYHTGMDVDRLAGWIFDYTSGYPVLVSRLCQLMDEVISQKKEYEDRSAAWTQKGFYEALRMILAEKSPLFESLIGKLKDYPELNGMLQALLFTGRSIVFNADEAATDMAAMFGFIKNQNGNVAIANRIFEIRLYNYYLSTSEMQKTDIYRASLQDKNQFVVDGKLDMRKVLEKFTIHFHEIYGDCTEAFIEDTGRKYFLLYLRPIINGTGNYYIEARTRDLRRTDVIVDYHGEQFIIEMKIWHGQEYHQRGEEQLIGYLNDYHVRKGYLLSFNFNKKKMVGVHEVVLGDKEIIEAVV